MSEINNADFKRKLSMNTPQAQSIASSPSLSPSPPPAYEHSQANVAKTVPRFVSHPNSPQLRPSTNGSKNNNDEDLVSAAEALTQLNRSVTPPNSDPTTSPTPQHPLVTKVNQVSKHPIVTHAVKYYEHTKRNYASFGYAAEIVEKTAIPVVSKIEDNLNSRHQRSLKKAAAAVHSNSSSTTSLASLTSINSEAQNTKKRRRFSGNANTNPLSVSLETKNRIQFCLHILRLANESINSKVNFLQQKVSEREEYVKSEREKEYQQQQSPILQPTELVNSEAIQTKTEIVTTVKKIIRLISNFKPSSLNPEALSPTPSNASEDNELKTTIRDIILNLPNAFQQSTITSSESAKQANDRIILFAKESLDMIGKLTNVLNDQLVKAEEWVAGAEEIHSQAQGQAVTQTQSEPEIDSSGSFEVTKTSSQSTIEESLEEYNTFETKRIKIEDSEREKMLIDS
ncbi:hypothetical protein DFJ63DRAFT_5860 [Scheffersomyces coipomensis]|uniref:uncharacterized protein n=1 Tax=Scheffersomyces coipomensis TaxID=1788519 RepID=UPI00315D514B